MLAKLGVTFDITKFPRINLTPVGRDGDDEFLWRVSRSLNLGLLVEQLGAEANRTGLLQVALGAGVLGRRDHLHGLRDLLDVLDGLEAHRDVLKGGHPALLLGLLHILGHQRGQASETSQHVC